MRNAMARPAMVRLVLCGLASVVMGEEGGGVPYHALRAAGQPQGDEDHGIRLLQDLPQQRDWDSVVSARVGMDGQCSNGVSGVESPGGTICCASECGTCGGTGCGSIDGLTADECCTGNIESSGVMCSDSGEAPCVIDDATSTTGTTCGNGVTGVSSRSGYICCVEGCGTCGGVGCSSAGGLSADECCMGNIESSGVSCSDSNEAPCIIDNSYFEVDGPPPTPAEATTNTISGGASAVPSPVMTIASSCRDSLPSIRYVESTGLGGRMYVEGKGCVTMTDLYKTRVSEEDGVTALGPIYVLDKNDKIEKKPTKTSGRWLITSELHITTGAVFYCRGTKIGGDCSELRIQSTGSKDFHEIRGHGGSMYFERTLVTSWDTPNRRPQESHKNGRSFLNCVSEKTTGDTCRGKAKNNFGECRMDIIDSEMGYLGYDDAESYGLTWKVRGFCVNLSNPEVFKTTNVYGNIIDSDIHHMYYGMYSYGHLGGVWTGNKMHDNHQYGFDPHDDSDYLTIADNDVYDNVNHGIIASKRCNHLEIYDNKVYNTGPEGAGIFLHRSSNKAKVYNNYIHDVGDGGIVLMESFENEIYDNVIKRAKYGIRLTTGSGDNNIHDNVFDDCEDAGLYVYEGSEAPDATSNSRPIDNKFEDNKVRNTDMSVWLRQTDNWRIAGNEFTDSKRLEFKDVTDTTWKNNYITGTACLKVDPVSDTEETFTNEVPAHPCY